MLLLILLSTLSAQAAWNLDHKPPLALLLSDQDDGRLLQALFQIAEQDTQEAFPLIYAMEPGPLEPKYGPRLLANHIVPKAPVPELLLISTLGRLEPNNFLLAFVRRCLSEGGNVWLVGDNPPDALLDLDLAPGVVIQFVPPSALAQKLTTYFQKHDPIMQNQ